MQDDIEIARSVTPRPIEELAGELGLAPEEWRPCDRHIAKIDPAILGRPRQRPGAARLVLVSAITPTPAGEGKTTTSIGLAQALARLGESTCLALREPSLGPAFGMKGGATGGGRSQILPMEKINLHFTGDFHAITSAHNLLAALLDNHVYFGNKLGIDPRRILWRRVLDMNDRALRNVIVGLGGPKQGVPRETGFDITAASEVMAMLCLAQDEDDLRVRIDRLLVGFTYDGEPVTAEKLGASGAMLALLHDALWPNLVQTLEGTPAIVHGGPFANIAHGCNSVVRPGRREVLRHQMPRGGSGYRRRGAGGDRARPEAARGRFAQAAGSGGPDGRRARASQLGEARGEHPRLRGDAGGGPEPLRR